MLLAVYFPADPALRTLFFRDVLGPVVDQIPSSSHLLIIGDFNLVEDPAMDKTSGCGSSSENEKFFLRCCSFQLSDAFRVLHPRKREYTFYSAAQQESSRIDRALVSQSLLPHLSLASHEMPKEPIADHGFAIHVAFRLDAKVRTGPGIWRLHASMLRRPGVRKVIEVTLRHTPVNDGSSFELLLSRLSVGLWSYAREEGKCVKATLAHLHRAVAVLKQELMGDPGYGRKKALLAEKEQQLKAYHAARRDKLHLQAGLTAELTGEIASKHLSAKFRARKARTQIAELKGLHRDTKTWLLINGWLGEGMEVVSGVRQGCPLAPYLFLCAVEPLAQEVERRKLGLSEAGRQLGYLGYADDTTPVLQGKQQIVRAVQLLSEFEKVSGLATNADKTVVLPLGVNTRVNGGTLCGFKRASADDAERLLGVWVSPSGSGVPTWEKALGHISGKLVKWKQKYLTTSARATVVNSYITPIIAFQAQVYSPPATIWEELMRLIQGFISENRVSGVKGFQLWSNELLFKCRAAGGIGVRDPEMIIMCLATRRVGLFLIERKLLKKEIMTLAADLPLGADTFEAHEKLIKHWSGRGIRWKQTCEIFMRSPFGIRAPAGSREEVLRERIFFNRKILLNGTTPVGGQQDAQRLKGVHLGDLLVQGSDGELDLKTMAALTQQLGGNGPAKLALKALRALPAASQSLLGFPTVPPCSADSPQRLVVVEGGRVVSERRMKEGWRGAEEQSYKQQKWAEKWRGTIDWKRAIATRDSLSIPSQNWHQLSISGADSHRHHLPSALDRTV
ncbi:unnamed protein product [Closterium sp. NIES-65]|nr:unnamed protein product [Closterium sp. NIES-65]